jgi:SHS2 domain-containing protein
MTKKFEFLEHTADIKVLAYGKTFEESFANAAVAMFQVMTETSEIKPRRKIEVNVTGSDEKNLLYTWLEKLLYLMNTEGFLLHRINSISVNSTKLSLKAIVVGDTIAVKGKDRMKYETHGEVKAITYNEMNIKKKPFVIQFVIDI